jgi:ATP-dependent helicase/nuclease subunit A
MSTAQFLAADPKVSAWVAASAGTGKTKVLTDRILNLLLQGFAPERILCLTFTKAAAAEMSNRLMQRLARWATLPLFELSQELESLTGETPLTPPLVSQARQLFARVLDAPGGMKILTIHGFCQSILGRFPLEAGIPPHFHILDECQAEEALEAAQHEVFSTPKPMIQSALALLYPYMADQRFSTILEDFYQHRGRVDTLLKGYESIWDYVSHLLDFLEIDALVESPEEILDPALGDRLRAEFAPNNPDFEAYVSTYLTQKKEIRKKLNSDQMRQAESVFRFVKSLSALEVVQRTVATLVLFQDILIAYQARKARICVLDYDDLILMTKNLLMQPGIASWVLYKLDGGIDHLLIDEAQDTNGLQWEIILRLTHEFFNDDKPYRTIFAVGDAKQSIYSFQGANPEDFLKLKDHFATLTQKIGQSWRDIQLDLSYRSTAAVLSIIDEIFANDQNKRGVSFGGAEVIHQVFRESSPNHLPGLVELWPLIQPQDDDEEVQGGEWTLPLERVERRSAVCHLADFIADQVAQWVTSKGVLPSTNQPIQPRDILILLRKRSRLGQEIISALKKRNIPVAGADRLMLTDHIAVMDLLSLGQFTLLPEDDLNLACVLRSPLIGLSEDDLFTLAHGRSSTLWASLSEKADSNPSFEAAHSWLKLCLREGDLTPVYEFYSWVLTQMQGRRRFLSRLGHEAEDALEEFLMQCLNYDQHHASSLQGFVHFMNNQHQEIKRDASDTVHNQVRIMTVHGSKGLQAPIVILPDAAESGKGKTNPLLWGNNLVMMRPTQIQDTEQTLALKNKAVEGEANEKNRLLYVALTRAQDRLYVGGCTTGKDLAPDCWYQVVKDALDQKTTTNRYLHGDHAHDLGLIGQGEVLPLEKNPLPQWALSVPQDVMQSKPDSPEKVPSTSAIERGILIHRFFEYLPALSVDRRYKAACQMIMKEGLSLSDWEKDIQESLTILDHPDFRDIFGPNSLAEVPLSGMMDGVPFQGRIDRLLVTPHTLTIVDYKTNRVPPTDLKDIPQAYVKQLEGYAVALRTIYPHHQIRKMLLWTEGPTLQLVESCKWSDETHPEMVQGDPLQIQA